MFQQAKTMILEHVGLAKDALHVYVALIVFLAVCRLFRWPVSSWKPWLAVLAVTVFGEALDLRHSLAKGYPIELGYHWTDLWNTMLVPTVLMLAARYTSIFKQQDEAEQAPKPSKTD